MSCPRQDRQTHDAVARKDDRRKDGVSREGFGGSGAGDHQRDDQRHFDHGHGHRENQRPVRLADTVRDDLCMVNRASTAPASRMVTMPTSGAGSVLPHASANATTATTGTTTVQDRMRERKIMPLS
jgi:hypothetical protein